MQATMEKPVPHQKKAGYRAGRGADGRFLPGSSGNPNGRPRGSRNRASLLVETLLDGRIPALAAAPRSGPALCPPTSYSGAAC